MTHLLKDLAGATGSLLWPLHRPTALRMLAWAGDAGDLEQLGGPTPASESDHGPTRA
jgi:hypothetical protein